MLKQVGPTSQESVGPTSQEPLLFCLLYVSFPLESRGDRVQLQVVVGTARGEEVDDVTSALLVFPAAPVSVLGFPFRGEGRCLSARCHTLVSSFPAG